MAYVRLVCRKMLSASRAAHKTASIPRHWKNWLLVRPGVVLIVLVCVLPNRSPQMAASLHVALVAPEIHWNTGNAGRSCLAAGAQLHLIRPLGFSLADRRVRRAGLDYWPRVAPVVWDDWDRFAAELPRLGSPIFFSAEAERAYWDVAYPERSVLVFGCEGHGLPRALRDEHSPCQVRLPMADPELRSLNLSTSVGVALYEVLRQRRERDG